MQKPTMRLPDPFEHRPMFHDPVSAAPITSTVFACSAAQRRFWLLDRIEPGNPALNVALRWRLEGRVSSADLNLAFATIVGRHDTLRTCFAEQDGEPVQIVADAVPFHVPDIDLTALSEDEAYIEAERIAQLEARACFELSLAPLFRVTHLRVRAEVSIILVTAHQMVCDGWSTGLLAREFGTLCAASSAAGKAELAALPIRYGEYAERTAQSALHRSFSSHDQFWMRAMQDRRYFELRPDRPRPQIKTSNSAIRTLMLDPAVAERLQKLGQRNGCTLFTTMLAALFGVLHRYSGETDIAVGTQVAGRDEVGTEDLVGLFINTIVLACEVDGHASFSDLLLRLRGIVAESLEHSETPLEHLVEILKPQRDLSRNVFFSVNFNLQRSFVQDRRYGSFSLVDMPSCAAGTMFDLNFLLVERPSGLRISCEYNTDLFEADTVARLLNHFVNLLRAASIDPAVALSAMPMLDHGERSALIRRGNCTDAHYPDSLTVSQLFEAQAKRTPHAVALCCGAGSLSYCELDAASNRLAHRLLSRGIQSQSRVAVCLDRSADLVIAMLAVLKAGCSYVPLDPAYPVGRLAHIFDDAQPSALLTKQALRDRLPACQEQVQVLLLDVQTDDIGQPHASSPGAIVLPDDVAYTIYTSGSSGRPKGVQIQHRALMNLLWSMSRRPGLSSADTLASVTTVSFDIAALEIFLPLMVGAKLVLAREEETGDGHALCKLLRHHRVSVMQATPMTWQILLASDWRADPPLKMLCGGEALQRSLADQLLKCGELWNLYGPTETTIWSSVLRVRPGSGAVCIGLPIANTRFYVLDQNGQLLPDGVAGELCIGGDGVALGYLNLEQMNRERFIADGFSERAGTRLYRTGDRVRRKADGEFEFLGRNDQQIKVRGFRIELGEIESVLMSHPLVAECVAIVALDASGEHAVHAYVVAHAERPLSRERLQDRLSTSLREALPGYMCPARLTLLEAMPRTPNGKIDRAALPGLETDTDTDTEPTPEQPADADPAAWQLQQQLCDIWCEVLGLASVGLHANFFEIGGHSLLAVRLASRIEAGLGRKLSLATLFKNPTVAEQAGLLQGSDLRSFDFRQVVKLQPNGSRPPLIAVNNTGIYYLLSKRLGADQPFTSLQLFDPSLPQASMPTTLEEIAAEYVQLIRRLQRNGPYRLLGWCIAGTLAYEVARQLSTAGQTVSELMLFDTWAPGHQQRQSRLRSWVSGYSYRWKLIVADWTRARKGPRPLTRFLSNRIIVQKLMRLLPSAASSPDAAPAEGGLQNLEQYDEWLLNYLQAAVDAYELKVYAGTMRLFRCSEEPAGRFLDDSMGWRSFVEGGVQVQVISGDHFSAFQEPGVSQIAQHIERILSGGSSVQPP